MAATRLAEADRTDLTNRRTKMTDFDNIDTAKSYATEENLSKALAKLGLSEKSHIVVRNRAGRFTAIFYCVLHEFNGDVAYAARAGFKSVG